MAIPRILRRWRLRTMMIVVALVAVGLGTYLVWPVYRLIGQLRIGDVQTRRQAALRIGLLGPRAAFATWALDSALDDPDPVVRSNAMYSLVRLGGRSPRLLPILAEQIERTPVPEPGYSPRSPVVWSFGGDILPAGWALSDGGLYDNDPIDALKIIRPDAAAFVPLLGKALKSPDRWVRQAALEALFAVATWSDPSGQEPASTLLAVLAEDRRNARTDESEAFSLFRDRKRAVDALAKQGPAAQEKAVAQLAGDLRDLGSPRSYEAALLLPRLQGGTAAAASILLDVIRDGDGDDTRRQIAMILLGPIAGPAEAPTVLRAITAPGAERKINLRGRLHWWESVGAREGGPGFQRFVKGLYRIETTLVESGVEALKAMGAPVEARAIRELIATVREPGTGTQRRCCAIIALGEFGPAAVEAIPALEEAIRAHEAADRGASREFAAPDSPGALATRALGKIAADGSPEAIAILARLVADPTTSVAPDASWVLILVGPKARPAVPALVEGLKDPRQVVRAHSIEALGKIGGPDVRAVLPALMAALDDENGAVRQRAAEAVGRFGAEAKAAVPQIVEQLWESGDFVIVQSVGSIGPDAAIAIPALLYWEVKKPPVWGQNIRAAMEKIMPRTPGATVAGSIAAMKAGDPAGRRRAVYELGWLIAEPPHPAEAVAALGEALGDPDALVRQIAAALLGRLAPTSPNAGPLLSRAARDPDEAVRRLAAWGLGRARRRSEPTATGRWDGHAPPARAVGWSNRVLTAKLPRRVTGLGRPAHSRIFDRLSKRCESMPPLRSRL